MYKKTGIVTFLLTFFFIASLSSFYAASGYSLKTTFSRREQKIQQIVLEQIINFRDYVKDSLLSTVNNAAMDTFVLHQKFLQSRLLFKQFEWAASYFNAELTERLNGPPVQEIENADLLDPSMARAIDPMGLQVIEPLIYPNYNPADNKELIREIENLITNTGYLITYFKEQQFADWRILDAAKLEIFRIITLGITGFDNALSLKSMEESATSLESLRRMLSFYTNKKSNNAVLQNLDTAIEYLRQHPDFASFDRALFITHFANKISTDIAGLQRSLTGPQVRYNRLLWQGANTLFDTDAFNLDAFSPGPEFHMTPSKIELGEKLFFDVLLSGNGKRSCASCHRPELAFTDGMAKNTDIHHPKILLPRNTPTLLNAALQSNYFYDMRALTLEEQIWDVIGNKAEMDGSMDAIVKYVANNKSYQSLFAKAFPATLPANPIAAHSYYSNAFSTYTKNGINAEEVANAIASYVRSLTKLNSRFDDYMQGNEKALSQQELNGFNLFMGKAKCATCHFVPLFNGITPPKYVQSETEVIGVPASVKDSILDPDAGYYNIIGIESYRNAFKIPTVRNITKTAPYMHNGAYQSLEEVMEFYNNAGAVGLKIDLPNQTLPPEKLNLTELEKQDIIAFIKSLDSKD